MAGSKTGTLTRPNVRRAPTEPGTRGSNGAAYAPALRRGTSAATPDTDLLLRQSLDLLDRLRRAVEARQ